MADDLADIVDKLEDALNRGFGLIITTGGVGAAVSYTHLDVYKRQP